MKKLFYVLLTVFLLNVLFFACTNGTIREELVWAEKQMEAHPDSALTILKEIGKKSGSSQMSKKQYALWCLLLTQAQDKNYIIQPSDSLIRIAVNYFEKRNDKPHRMKAYYYNAVIYHDMGDSPHAQEYYLKALEAGKESDDHAMLGRIYANLGSMYNYQNLTEEAKTCQEKAVEHFSIMEDSVNIGITWRNIGRIYSKNGALDSAVVYYSKAMPFLSKQNRSSIYNEIGGIYKRMEQYPKAFEYIDSALVSPMNKNDAFAVYLNKGDLYRQTGQYDSACFYLFLSLASPGIYIRSGANHSLSYLEEKRGDYTAAFKYMEKHLQLQDSINKAERSRDLKNIESLYNYNLIEKERVFHAMKSRQKTSWIYSLILCLILITGSGFLFYQRKKQLTKKNHDKELLISKQKYEQGQLFIEEKEEEIRRLKEAQEQGPDKHQKYKLAVQEQVLNMELEYDKQKRGLRKGSYIEFEKSDLCKLFLFSKNIPKKEDWLKLDEWRELLYPDMRSFLKNMHPKVDEKDIRMCFLLKIGIQGKRMSALFNVEMSTISQKKKRLCKLLTDEKSSAKDLDLFLAEMFKAIE
ncbi:MAG: tetratricopeptide repeat protein [Tannerellaceae bacterium]|jgi:tetratricopeptide (TPR) repeat protein|nr:tetratricopeptide repeat protein [Tannerellaceae bacterium]